MKLECDHEIYIPIFNTTIGIVRTLAQYVDIVKQFTTNKKDIKNALKPCNAVCGMRSNKDGEWIFAYIPKNCKVDILVHEAEHLKDFVLEHTGVEHDTEVDAYLVQYIFNELCKIRNE